MYLNTEDEIKRLTSFSKQTTKGKSQAYIKTQALARLAPDPAQIQKFASLMASNDNPEYS